MKSAVVGCLVLLLGLAGCTKDGKVHLTGQVTLDGVPLQTGEIRFTPVGGKGVLTGAPIQAGKYEVDVPPGPKTVEISGYEKVGERPAYEGVANGPTIPQVRQIAQQKLAYDVTTSGTKDFDVKKK